MNNLKRYYSKIYFVIFYWKGKVWLFNHLKLITFSLGDFLRVFLRRRAKAAIWKQLIFQRYFRHPQLVFSHLGNSLRVCITYRCNLACRYCYAKGVVNSIPADMTVKDFLKLAIWAKEKDWNSIRFLGGEPTINPFFLEMLDICYNNKITVSLSTNNTFASQIGEKLNKSLVHWISINYIFNRLDNKQPLFNGNLKQLNTQGIPFEFSCIISNNNDDWSGIFKDSKLYKPMCIRASIAIPGLSKQTSIRELVSNLSLISHKLFKFQETCIKLNIPFYIYRPLMPCMFLKEEWEKLKKDFPFICFTRCPLGAMGDYSRALVVNPDLSIFPCNALFIKGPNIFTFENREGISNFYKDKVKQMLSEPLMESCKSCKRHSMFISNLDKGNNSDVKSSFSEGLCQAGCISFKDSAQSLCYLE